MTEKQKIMIDGLVNALPDNQKEIYRELAEYAVSLGYTPKKLKPDGTYLAFSKSKVNRTIIKILANHNECIDAHDIPGLYLKFYANKEYSEPFRQGVKKVLEHFGGKYTGCYGCGKCDGTHGYIYTYPDGKQLFKCGGELVELPPISKEHITEIKSLLKTQDEFFMKNLEDK